MPAKKNNLSLLTGRHTYACWKTIHIYFFLVFFVLFIVTPSGYGQNRVITAWSVDGDEGTGSNVKILFVN